MRIERWLLVFLAWCLLVLAPAAVQAIEPAQAFLDGLRERGLYDVALDYLDSAAQNPAVPVSFKETLAYEKAVTLIQGARLQRDTSVREKQLDEGQKTLQEFVSAQPSHLLAMSARSQMGNVIVERARIKVERAKKSAAGEKDKLNQEAQTLYLEAGKVFAALVEELRTKLKAYPAVIDEKKEAKRAEERDRFRMDFLQGQLLVAATREEMADTLPKDSKQWSEALTAAAGEYKKVYEDYRTRLAGLYARMYQGRCLQKLGKHKEASAILNELLANPDAPEAFRALKIKVMALAVDSWLAQDLWLEVLKKREQGGTGPVELVSSARPAEERQEEICAIRMAIAKASKLMSDDLKKKNARDPQAKLLLTDGRKQLAELIKFPNPYQEEARRLMPEYAGGNAEAVAERKEPKTFQEARTAAKEAIDAMQSANLLLKSLPALIARSKAEEKPELEKQLDEAKVQSKKGQEDALHYCRLALKLIDKETDVNDVNLIRYLLCFLSYTEGNYFDAVVIGDFLARRYPDSQGARACAKIAMASYLKLYADNTSDDKEFESARIVEIADFIVKKWPDQPEAEEALNTLIPFMIRAKQLKQAEDYLAKIPQDSPHRGNAELKTGQALWASYIENSRQVREWENEHGPEPEKINIALPGPASVTDTKSPVEPAPQEFDIAARKLELETLKTKAKQTLIDGVKRMEGAGAVTPVLVSAMLSLAQIYVDTNEPAKAVKLLEDPKVGVLTLVTNNDPAVAKEGYAEETYKTALRAYISSLSAGADPKTTVEKARGVMDALKQRMGQTPQGQAKLVAIYVSLAKDLQQQMEIAEPAVKKSLGLGFENFLGQVAADATELNILNWVAETYRAMGESYGTGLKSLTPEAKGYFTKAAQTYQKILDMGQKDASFLTAPMTTQLQIQLGRTKKSMGDYIGARDTFEKVLKVNPMLLPVQIEAARLYQDWGGTGKGQEGQYLKAMFGDRPDNAATDPAKKGKNVIWGWGEIAKMTASSKQFRDQFFEARYNLALCRFNYALSQADAAKKKETLAMSRRDIAVTVGFYPDLGDKWKPQFDSLLKTVQKALGEQPVGLPALQSSPANGKTAAAKAK
jgi:hypothetical protein